MVRLEGLGKLKKKFCDLTGTRTRDLLAYNIAPQPSTLPRALLLLRNNSNMVIAHCIVYDLRL
jgi:hypothetical protein